MLKCFGPTADAAAVVLAKNLSTDASEFPRGILETLAAMGPADRGAHRALERFRNQVAGEEPLSDITNSRPDETTNPVGWAIWANQTGN